MFRIHQRPIVKFSGLGPGHQHHLKVFQVVTICSQECEPQDSSCLKGMGMSLEDRCAILSPFLEEERGGSI